MADGFAAGGRIDISIVVGDGRIACVSLKNGRHFNHGRLLRGLRADEAVRRISQIFAVCRFSQGVAAASAFERAAGFEPCPAQAGARQMLVLAETLLDHGTRILLEWPALEDKPPFLLPLKAIRLALTDLCSLLYPHGDWCRPGGGQLRPVPEAILARLSAVETALAEANLLSPRNLVSWDKWLAASHGAAAQHLAVMVGDGSADIAAASFPFLTTGDEASVLAALTAQGPAFAANPSLDGGTRETGPYPRLHGHPMIAAWRARHGDGLLIRFAAQLLEIGVCLDEMRKLAPQLGESDGETIALGDATGSAMIEAARGSLMHKAEVKDGLVKDYWIVAPTEWNFHPDGPFAAGLMGKECGAGAEKLARLFAAALDPCVETNIAVSGHA